eukprot:TRINITY_DN73605_c0_g1_i1.p1 TRINITY_DN73605_c0_g1~~TRINITY_DN73605_c0_g1_i1.p1  ORF type:complete len:568 (+),score=167.00 TRINITY_DN73605_c0_g1_i1:53-1705(+)
MGSAFSMQGCVDPEENEEDEVSVMDDESVCSTGSGLAHYSETGTIRFTWNKLWNFAGPGLLMSVAYLDPGNLEADLQTGAKGKYELLWVLLMATGFGFVLQNFSSLIGVATGKHLAQLCKAYPPVVRYTLWVMTEVALICADCQEVIGSALALNILTNGAISVWFGCIVTALDCFLFMLLDRRGIRHLEALFAVLITTMAVAFGVQYFARLPSQYLVVEGIVLPRMRNQQNFHTSIGLIGAVIMPHNLFLHSALVLSRRIDRKNPDPVVASYRVKEALTYNRIETGAALVLSFVINLFVVCVFAHLPYFNADGSARCTYRGVSVVPDEKYCKDITGPCTQIGLETAGNCLNDAYGQNWWLYVWAVGLFAAGQASTITGTYAGQFIMEGFIDLRISPTARVAISRCVSLVPALFVAVETTGHPGGMDSLNSLLNVAQSVQLPFAVLPALYFASSRRVCGEFAVKGRVLLLAWMVAGLVLAANLYAIFLAAQNMPAGASAGALFGAGIAVYTLLILYLTAVAAGVVKLHLPGRSFGGLRQHDTAAPDYGTCR